MGKKFEVKIMPRPVLLDVQGRAVEQTLQLNHLPQAKVRVGKFVELELEGADSLEAARLIAEKILINPLIENFEIVELF